MRELAVGLKQLRMHGMASAWSDLMEQGGSAARQSSRWLQEQLLQAETTAGRRHLTVGPRGGIRYGLRPWRLRPREHQCAVEVNEAAINPHLSTADHHAVGAILGSILDRKGGPKFGRRGQVTPIRCSMAATCRPSLRAAADNEPVSAVSRSAFSWFQSRLCIRRCICSLQSTAVPIEAAHG